MPPRLQNQVLSPWNAFWNRLTEPSVVLKNPLEREQSRLLTSTLWIFLLTTCVLFIVRLIGHGLHNDVELYARASIIAFVLVAIFFSRRGQTRLISLISAAAGTLVIFYLAIFGGDVAGLPTFAYLAAVIIFGSLFLPLWLNALILLIQLLGMLAFAWLLPNMTLVELVSGPFSLLLTVGMVALVMTHYRNSLENAHKMAITLSEKHFRSIFETSPIGIRLYDAGGQFQSANPTSLNNFGFLQGASRQPPNLFADPIVSAEIKERLNQGELVRFVNKFDPHLTPPRPGFPLSEEIRFQDISITPLKENGESQGYLMQLVDISEEKRVEEVIRARRNNLLLISDNLPAMIAHLGADQRYIFTNQPYAEFFKTSAKTIIGSSLRDVVGAEVYERLSVQSERALAGERVEFEIALDNSHDDLRLMQAIFVPDIEASGRVCAYVAMFQDITERKKAEASLTHKAAQLELLNQVGQHLNVLTSTSEVLNRAVQLVQQSFNYHGVSIFLADESFKDWVLMAKAGDYADTFPEELRLQPEIGIVGWVASHGETRLANDVNADPVYTNPYPSAIPTQAELCVPILIDAQVIGVLDVQSPEINAFDEGDVLVMETMAEQISVSIENARLHTSAKQELAERKRAEELLQAALRDKEVLLKEVHHRIKNNMQVIASMLNLRAEKLSDPRAIQAFQDCQNSISAIASVHKSLYESTNQASINADEYLRNLIERLKNSFFEKASEITHNVSIEPVRLDFDTAIPCGLILNELLTNVYKYAFPPEYSPGQTRTVSVTLSEKEAQLFLSIRDNGVGFPTDFETRKDQALGLQLVGLLAKQIKGSLTMEGNAGVVVEIVFPSSRLKSEG